MPNSVGFVVFPIMQIYADTYIKFLQLLCLICPSAHVNILHFTIESNFFFFFKGHVALLILRVEGHNLRACSLDYGLFNLD